MKKQYEMLELKLVVFGMEDVIRTSKNDNVTDMPDFPEDFSP